MLNPSIASIILFPNSHKVCTLSGDLLDFFSHLSKYSCSIHKQFMVEVDFQLSINMNYSGTLAVIRFSRDWLLKWFSLSLGD